MHFFEFIQVDFLFRVLLLSCCQISFLNYEAFIYLLETGLLLDGVKWQERFSLNIG
jgi:hypothetical protein